MAKLKSDKTPYVEIEEREYLQLLEDHLMMNALRKAGIENLPMFISAKEILKDGHIEVHIKPVKHYHK